VNGRAYPLTWLSSTTWSATVPLMAGINPLEVRGFDGRGVAVTGAVDWVQVTNAGLPAFRPVAINEWMAANQGPGGFPEPQDGSFADWFELYNPNTNAIELSGMQLTDNLAQPSKWTIPGNVFIGPLGFMLVWADGATNRNPAWGGTNIDLHAPFQLSNGGEAIALFAPGGMTLLSGVSFGRQTPNVSEGRYPDGETNTVYSMARWTPRAPNEVVPLPVPRFIEVKAAELGLTLVWETVPGRVYRVEHAEDLAVPVWTTLGLPQRATGARASANDVPIDGEGRRFYRVALVP
jgi:hypothetical protein